MNFLFIPKRMFPCVNKGIIVPKNGYQRSVMLNLGLLFECNQQNKLLIQLEFHIFMIESSRSVYEKWCNSWNVEQALI
jgi:hypothetical protein